MTSWTRSFLLVLYIVAAPLAAIAHGGGLDGQGCHHDRRAGGYHCHRGPMAGQHFQSKDQALSVLPSIQVWTAAPTLPSISGRASVIDGDTLDIHGRRIRLHGIDAPESGQFCRDQRGDDYRCGQYAALALSDKIGARTVSCEQTDIDRYGRIVAVCWAGGIDLNGWLVREGWAVAYRRYSGDYIWAEAEARSARRGIWAGSFIPPEEWRRR